MAREQRRLAAILFADVVGSSRLMGRDESGTVARLLEHLNRRLAPAAARRGGRVIRLTGDGGLVEFASAVDALARRLSSSKPWSRPIATSPKKRPSCSGSAFTSAMSSSKAMTSMATM